MCWKWTPPPIPASTTCARSTTACAMRRRARATRSTSSTKSTCSRPRRSTRFSRLWKSRRSMPNSCSPPPRSAKCRSRCQRFDLRRVEADVLMKHLGNIAGKENVEVETEALGIIARAAEGSVRDSLSLFDQAIAHAAGPVRADAVRQMLGLADRTRVIDLFEQLARGDIASAFREFREQYDTGADPIVVLSDLAEFVNFVTRVKIVPATADNVAFGETERLRARDFAAKLSMRVLSRMWQMLLKGIAEAQAATRPAAAAEMVLVRIAYVADMPTPAEAIRMLEQNGGSASSAAASSSASARAESASPASAMQTSPP